MSKGKNEATKTITAWAVEINGKICPSDVCRTRDTARFVRNSEASLGYTKSCHVRKVQIQVVKGR